MRMGFLRFGLEKQKAVYISSMAGLVIRGGKRSRLGMEGLVAWD
jgi:hypothetical protein